MKLSVIKILIALAICLALYLQNRQIVSLKEERDTAQSNVKALMLDVQIFRVSDSLNAAKVQSLQLEMHDIKKHRTDDDALIKNLQIKNRELVSMTTAQLQTIRTLEGRVMDTTIIVENIPTEVRQIKFVDQWLKFNCTVFPNNEFKADYSEDLDLKLLEAEKYRKFLFWRIKRHRKSEFSIVSLNPYTRIRNVEHIKVKK